MTSDAPRQPAAARYPRAAAGSRRAEPRRRATRPRPPLALAIPGVPALAFLVAPFVALVASAPGGEMTSLLDDGPAAEALWLSLRPASLSAVLCVVLGVPLAWLLAHDALPLPGLVRALVTMPMVLPPVVGGVALLALLGRRGLLGEHLDAWFGVQLPFTTAAVVVAQTFVALPFLVISVDAALRAVDPRLAQVAASLGGSRWYVFRRVTLPVVAPGVAAGAVLAFARALGEFGATITFAGNFPGVTRTMPVAIYLALERDRATAVALSLVLVAVSLVVLVALRSRWLGGLAGLAARGVEMAGAR
ncbi:ABC transporter permease [Sanguibacter massiliensis]|uniref:ABC transporter permease n=1 Tax=Sanguibacter massiliensis TaxID=1973217 RepID=UPI001F5DBC4F|nr:ABC transporter permease [Sanguibacter massiliensis]